jgi:2-oxoglutarate ferredoxin oxidoreductase subunit delta
MKQGIKPLGIDTVKVPKGTLHIIRERCKSCGFCIEFCPKKVLELSEEYNLRGYHFPYIKYPDKCISCGLCTRFCPDFAIYQISPKGTTNNEDTVN